MTRALLALTLTILDICIYNAMPLWRDQLNHHYQQHLLVARDTSDKRNTVRQQSCTKKALHYNRLLQRVLPTTSNSILLQHTNDCLFEDLVTVVSIKQILNYDSHDGNHGKTSIVDLLVLVIDPALIAVIHPVRCAEQISRHVTGTLLNVLCEPFNGTTSKNELQPSYRRKLFGSLQGIRRKSGVKSGV